MKKNMKNFIYFLTLVLNAFLVTSCFGNSSYNYDDDNDATEDEEEQLVECPVCEGDGEIWIDCSVCNGKGSVSNTTMESRTRTCSSCYGTGKAPCNTCGNYGYVKCKYCNNGRTHCSYCNGVGGMIIGDDAVICPVCEGGRYEKCRWCDYGKTDCPSCYGKGYRTCSTCGGNGGSNHYASVSKSSPCPSCDGDAGYWQECPKCDGKGRISEYDL